MLLSISVSKKNKHREAASVVTVGPETGSTTKHSLIDSGTPMPGYTRLYWEFLRFNPVGCLCIAFT
mgnify:CR=1 FL=1|jgi:hypothetical protein